MSKGLSAGKPSRGFASGSEHAGLVEQQEGDHLEVHAVVLELVEDNGGNGVVGQGEEFGQGGCFDRLDVPGEGSELHAEGEHGDCKGPVPKN